MTGHELDFTDRRADGTPKSRHELVNRLHEAAKLVDWTACTCPPCECCSLPDNQCVNEPCNGECAR